jgi:uncharacterized protein (DUF1778 family)
MPIETNALTRPIAARTRVAAAYYAIIRIRLAAALAGETATSFVWTAVDNSARDLLAEGHHLIISKEASRALRRAPN